MTLPEARNEALRLSRQNPGVWHFVQGTLAAPMIGGGILLYSVTTNAASRDGLLLACCGGHVCTMEAYRRAEAMGRLEHISRLLGREPATLTTREIVGICRLWRVLWGGGWKGVRQ